jgi:glycosyltransferase involved in cell wall biosynthesis
MGRIDKSKGVDVLVDAVLGAPGLPLQLDIYGIIQPGAMEPYVRDLHEKAQPDLRIRFLDPLPNDQIPQMLRAYDLVAIPSIWLETGPLTVYDAFAAGIPVLGSKRGGIAELVTHEQDGLLVAPGNVAAWSDALRRICSEDGLLERLSRGITKPRAMDAVALEMTALYESLLVEQSPEASVKLSEAL